MSLTSSRPTGGACCGRAGARAPGGLVNGGKLTLRKTLSDRGVRNVFLAGDRLLVFSAREAKVLRPGGWFGQQAVLAMYDISSLSQPKLLATLSIDGDVLDARLVGTQVRVATASSPDVDVSSPVYTHDGDISEKSKDELRAAVAKTELDDWILSDVPCKTAPARRSAKDVWWNAPTWPVRRSSRESTRLRCRHSTWSRLCSPAWPWA